MLYVIFNSDGSIKELIVGESIQQGDHLTKQVFAKIDGYSTNDYTCSGEFVLPTGDISQLVASEDEDETYGSGYSITLTEAQTLYAGNLKMNLKLIDLQDHVLCTYQVTLVINPTGYNPNTTNITQAQYNSLLQSLNSYGLKSWALSSFYQIDENIVPPSDDTYVIGSQNRTFAAGYINYLHATQIIGPDDDELSLYEGKLYFSPYGESNYIVYHKGLNLAGNTNSGSAKDGETLVADGSGGTKWVDPTLCIELEGDSGDLTDEQLAIINKPNSYAKVTTSSSTIYYFNRRLFSDNGKNYASYGAMWMSVHTNDTKISMGANSLSCNLTDKTFTLGGTGQQQATTYTKDEIDRLTSKTTLPYQEVTGTTTLAELVGEPRIIKFSSNYYMCCVFSPATGVYQYEFENLSSASRRAAVVTNSSLTLREIIIEGESQEYALASNVTKLYKYKITLSSYPTYDSIQFSSNGVSKVSGSFSYASKEFECVLSKKLTNSSTMEDIYKSLVRLGNGWFETSGDFSGVNITQGLNDLIMIKSNGNIYIIHSGSLRFTYTEL